MSEKTKVIGLRFIRSFISGFLATASLITIQSVSTWGDLSTALQALVLAATVGGINAVLLAGDKMVRWQD